MRFSFGVLMERFERLGLPGASSLELLKGTFVLFQLLASLAELALGGEALILVKLLDGLVYQLLDGGRLRTR